MCLYAIQSSYYLKDLQDFGDFKDVKDFVQMRGGNKRRNNANFKKVKTMIGTQWKVGYIQHSLHMHTYTNHKN